MSKFNTRTRKPAGAGPVVVTSNIANTVTHEGAPAFTREARSELFLLGVTNFAGEDTFYETAGARDGRFATLCRQVAVTDIAWMTRFVRWLRTEANMRSASIVAAAHGVNARLGQGLHGDNRKLIAGAMWRADEPGEMLAYWLANFGRNVPKPVKRGIGDAALELYAEYPLLKYDTDVRAVRWADVLELCHPGDRAGSRQGGKWQGAWQRDLFEHAIARRHHRDGPTPETLALIQANQRLRRLADGDPESLLDTAALRAAGMTWEDVLSLVGSKVPKGKLWAALIPVMGMMALARNLRNFDETGVPDEVIAPVLARFSNPDQVAKSRMMPFRWLAAHEAAPSLRWGHALDKALQASLANLPAFPGRTLVLVDTSASMVQKPMSAKSKMTPLHAASIFGVALAAKGEQVDLAGFADGTFTHAVGKGASVIREAERLLTRVGEVGHGTQIAAAVRARFHGHDRVVVISDLQTMDYGLGQAVPETTPLYTFNLGGYAATPIKVGGRNRVELGGLTDQTFALIPRIEAGQRADWDTIFGPAV